jgi:site-specific DNA-methyltransferase (adenine-specific)
MNYQLYHGDCLDILPTLVAGTVDAVICDPPYGTTACAWDSVIPFAPMWAGIKHVLKERGAAVLFGSQPFTSALVMSNPDWFKYEWVWEKTMKGDIMNAKNKPLKSHENIAVFSSGTTANGSDIKMIYYPQGLKKIWLSRKNYYRLDGQATFKPRRPSHPDRIIQEATNYPTSVLKFANGNADSPHPTAKPVALMEYLVKTYANEGDTVLDFTMGSGTTGVACMRTGRNFIGIELDKAYFEIAETRIKNAAGDFTLTEKERATGQLPLWSK